MKVMIDKVKEIIIDHQAKIDIGFKFFKICFFRFSINVNKGKWLQVVRDLEFLQTDQLQLPIETFQMSNYNLDADKQIFFAANVRDNQNIL